MRLGAWERTADGLKLRVRLTPRGGRDGIEGLETRSDGQVVLRARVSGAPEDGRANAALEQLVAAALGIPASTVRVVSGHRGGSRSWSFWGIRPDLMLDWKRL
jgi:uncharacterized protein YggU (UPF0235/DUF167 family)